MNRKYNLKLDLQFRCNNSIMKFNQFDNNTSDFFMRITNGGNLVDIEKAIVVLAIIKPSGKVSSQFVEVENGLVYADLKPNMKDEIGTYTAKAMLILEDERVVTDVISYEVEEDKIFSLLNDTVGTSEEFTLLTDMLSRLSAIEISEEQRMINEAERILSEENRKIEEAKRVEAELIRQHEEADRAKYDATRESNENIRKINEEARISSENVRLENEANRIEQEANRVKAEQLRKDNYNLMTEDEERRRSEANAHKEAEVLRVQAETNRVNEEAKRRTTEQARVSAENTRVSNESTRKANETTRQTNETHRVEAETQRQNRYNSFILEAEANANNFENYTNNAKIKEEERKSNELNRKSQEDRRVSNEVERISNENTRKANENARIESEKQRVDAENLRKEKIIEIQSDYDSLKKVIIDENASANLQNQINQTNSQLEHNENLIENYQYYKVDWFNEFQKIKTKNDDSIFINKKNDDDIYLYVNHYKNNYQRWLLSKSGSGLDNNVETHINGDAWQIKTCDLISLGLINKMLSTEASMNGSWVNYGGIYTSSTVNDTIEFAVNGSKIFIRGTFKPDGGIANIYIDNEFYCKFDMYDTASGGTTITKLVADNLENKDHIVKIEVAKEKSLSSSGYNVRIHSVLGENTEDIFNNLNNLTETPISMPSGRNFRYGQSAIEIAINTTFNNSSVWSGTYHKYLYPTENANIFIDGINLNNLEVSRFYICKDFKLIQKLIMQNKDSDIAEVKMLHHATSDGLHIKWDLKWLVNCYVNTSYNCMYGTSVNNLKFGDSQEVYTAIYDDKEHGNYYTDTIIGWNSTDDYCIGLKAINYQNMKYTNTPKGMYYRDRITDMKIYFHRFKGNVIEGDKWQSEFLVGIGHCPQVDLLLNN